jgi:hypothetical protein
MPEHQMHTTVHYSLDCPGASAEEMLALEALMRSPAYISAHLEMENIMANMFAGCSGFRLPFEITGEIHTIRHTTTA